MHLLLLVHLRGIAGSGELGTVSPFDLLPRVVRRVHHCESAGGAELAETAR